MLALFCTAQASRITHTFAWKLQTHKITIHHIQQQYAFKERGQSQEWNHINIQRRCFGPASSWTNGVQWFQIVERFLGWGQRKHGSGKWVGDGCGLRCCVSTSCPCHNLGKPQEEHSISPWLTMLGLSWITKERLLLHQEKLIREFFGPPVELPREFFGPP
jgi:hypothetical protein